MSPLPATSLLARAAPMRLPNRPESGPTTGASSGTPESRRLFLLDTIEAALRILDDEDEDKADESLESL